MTFRVDFRVLFSRNVGFLSIFYSVLVVLHRLVLLLAPNLENRLFSYLYCKLYIFVGFFVFISSSILCGFFSKCNFDKKLRYCVAPNTRNHLNFIAIFGGIFYFSFSTIVYLIILLCLKSKVNALRSKLNVLRKNLTAQSSLASKTYLSDTKTFLGQIKKAYNMTKAIFVMFCVYFLLISPILLLPSIDYRRESSAAVYHTCFSIAILAPLLNTIVFIVSNKKVLIRSWRSLLLAFLNNNVIFPVN